MASKRHVRRRQHQGKATHASMENAQIAVVMAPPERGLMRAYQCGKCRRFHIGHYRGTVGLRGEIR